MSVNRDRLYADLDALTERQIEVGLDAGVWNDPSRPLVEDYLSQLKLERTEAALAEQVEIARRANDAADQAKLRATAAIIIALGAMLAAVLAVLVLALRF
jgi:hypothetical protein